MYRKLLCIMIILVNTDILFVKNLQIFFYRQSSHCFRTNLLLHNCSLLLCKVRILIFLFYLPPGGSPERKIMKCSLCVRASVRASVRLLVCHADCCKTIAVTDFFSKKSPNEFSCPRIFFWFYSF